MSRVADTWLLPEGVEDILPVEAARLERLRRHLLDLYASCGYEQVFPPLIEFLDSLLTGSGKDLALTTFHMTDLLSGRTLGVRADMTPQVARIDAHCMPLERPARYCYAGTVLHTQARNLGESRSPIQMGCELYGCTDLAADIEVLRLMLDTLRVAGAEEVVLELGHVGIYRALSAAAALDCEQDETLFDILQRKAVAELDVLLASCQSRLSAQLASLPRLAGGIDVLEQAEESLRDSPVAVLTALRALRDVTKALTDSHPEVTLYFDLAELRGYHYHTGLTFAAYAKGCRFELAKGGRYDHVGEAFGRARPATGFSVDLKALLWNYRCPSAAGAIMAPVGDEAELRRRMEALRLAGERVIQLLPGQSADDGIGMGCDRQLQKQQGEWQLLPL